MRDKYEDEQHDDSANHPFEHITKKIQTDEEVDALSMDEDLPTFERFLLLMQSSHLLQNYCALNSLTSLLSERDVLKKILSSSEFRHFERRCNGDLQEHFEKILRQLVNALEPAELHEWLWPVIVGRTERILSSRKKFSFCPKGSLSVALSRFPVDALQGETPKMVEWTCDTRPESHALRLLGCEALGTCAQRVGKPLEASVLEHCIDLCQDSDYLVRAEICSKWIPSAMQVSDSETVSKQLFPELLELARDDMPVVQQAAYLCMVQVLPFLDKTMLEGELVPRIHEILKSDFGDMDSETCAPSLGPLAVNMREVFAGSPESGTELQKVLAPLQPVFGALATDKNEKTRLACAVNLPAIATVFCAVRWNAQAANALTALTKDSSVTVRATIAKGLHHVAAVARQEGQPLLGVAQDSCIQFTKDSSPEVRSTLLQELRTTLSCLFIQHSPPMTRESEQCVENLAKDCSWRTQHQIFVHAKHLLDQRCDHDGLIDTLLPLLFTAVLSGAEELLPAACTGLVSCVAKMSYISDRKTACKRLKKELGDASSCRLRMRFLQFCEVAANQWSSKLLCSSGLAEKVVALVTDKVGCIRLRVAEVLCAVRLRLCEVREGDLVDKITVALETLHNDEDPSVTRAAGVAQAEVATQSEVSPRVREKRRQAQETRGGPGAGSELASPEVAEPIGDEARDRAIEAAMKDFISEQSSNKLMPRRPSVESGRERPQRQARPRTPVRGQMTNRTHRRSLTQLDEMSGVGLNKLQALPPIGSQSGALTARTSRPKPELMPAPPRRRASNVTASTSSSSVRSAPSMRPKVQGAVKSARMNSKGRTRRLPSLHDNPL